MLAISPQMIGMRVPDAMDGMSRVLRTTRWRAYICNLGLLHVQMTHAVSAHVLPRATFCAICAYLSLVCRICIGHMRPQLDGFHALQVT